MRYDEQAVVFDCAGTQSVGILSLPAGMRSPTTGLLIVVGGPQYRIGSHRLFVRLARRAASEGTPAMRFDYRGMGDSTSGEMRGFEDVGDDLKAAVDTFFQQVPSLDRVVLWGLCDGASAACLYAPHDPRVQGLVLVNPWVHTPEGEAVTLLRHYYLKRLADPAFWRKLYRGEVTLRALKVLFSTFKRFVSARLGRLRGQDAKQAASKPATLPLRMGGLVSRSGARVAIALSDDDKVAREFEDQALSTEIWQSG